MTRFARPARRHLRAVVAFSLGVTWLAGCQPVELISPAGSEPVVSRAGTLSATAQSAAPLSALGTAFQVGLPAGAIPKLKAALGIGSGEALSAAQLSKLTVTAGNRAIQPDRIQFTNPALSPVGDLRVQFQIFGTELGIGPDGKPCLVPLRINQGAVVTLASAGGEILLKAIAGGGDRATLTLDPASTARAWLVEPFWASGSRLDPAVIPTPAVDLLAKRLAALLNSSTPHDLRTHPILQAMIKRLIKAICVEEAADPIVLQQIEAAVAAEGSSSGGSATPSLAVSKLAVPADDGNGGTSRSSIDPAFNTSAHLTIPDALSPGGFEALVADDYNACWPRSVTIEEAVAIDGFSVITIKINRNLASNPVKDWQAMQLVRSGTRLVGMSTWWPIADPTDDVFAPGLPIPLTLQWLSVDPARNPNPSKMVGYPDVDAAHNLADSSLRPTATEAYYLNMMVGGQVRTAEFFLHNGEVVMMVLPAPDGEADKPLVIWQPMGPVPC